MIKVLSFVLLIFVCATAAHADVTLASPFTDHMVLQRGTSVSIWGTAAPGEHVTVTFEDQSPSVTADASGKWIAYLKNLSAGGPHPLVIHAINTITLNDVLIGEVWLCSGQSNMDFTVAKTPKYYFAGVNNEAEEVAAGNYPQIRMFSGQWSKAYTPQSSIAGTWKVCTPENVREFSAIGYFFARDLHKALNVPVGIITETFGASTAESWIRREALEQIPEFKPQLEKFDTGVHNYTDEERRKYADALKTWQATTQASPSTRPARAPRNPDPVQDQHNPTVMYNGMIAPIVPYAIKGVLWYQGESIVGGSEGVKLYPKIQAALVRDWRTLWHNDDLPFYICQLAALKAASNSPAVRAAQATILNLPHTGMAVTIDIGDPKNVHPKNKQDGGDRLCRIALAKDYGQNIEYSGPAYDSMQIDGNTIRLKFTHANGGLIAKNSDAGELKTFTIAGPDGKFLSANARVDGDTVVVSSPDVTSPMAVRYAWEPYPDGCNLYNKAGLPAAPFTTELNP